MEKSFKDVIKHRRSYYAITNSSPIDDGEIENIVKFAVKNVPSAFNSQTSRLVLLLGDNHKKLWNIVKDTLRKIIPEAAFASTEMKINSFAAGYGSVLYFEEQDIVESLQEQFPLYKDNFPVWSEHTSAMHQFVVWTMLEEVGFGASLQHYNPLIDSEVKTMWNLPNSWRLVAQMPFGTPTSEPAEKSYQEIEERVIVFK